MRRLLTLLVILSLGVPLHAQYAGVSSGTAATYVNAASDVLRIVPSAAHLSLGLAGVSSALPFGDRLVESAIAHALCVGFGYAAKALSHVPRPDGSDDKSFPSGHALIAFTGAELMRMDYGNAWGAGAYVLSTGVGTSRVFTGRHWFSDVLAGASIGILCAHAGRWLLDPVKSVLSLPEWTWDGLSGRSVQVALVPGSDPLSGTPTAGLFVIF